MQHKQNGNAVDGYNTGLNVTRGFYRSGNLRIIYNAGTIREAVMSLVSAALKNGGIDNITAVLCHIKE